MKTENPDRSKNIVLFGPESSGKTTLCKELAGNFGGLWVPEYLRQFCESKAGLPGFEDMPEIFEGQRQIEAEFQESNPAILFFDTNPLQLMVYHQFYFETFLNHLLYHPF